MARLIDADALRLMKVEECAGHTIDYAAGWKACIDWVRTLPTVDGWISVKDRLPEKDSKKVLTYGNPVTHWMPLPEPPKEDDDAEQ